MIYCLCLTINSQLSLAIRKSAFYRRSNGSDFNYVQGAQISREGVTTNLVSDNNHMQLSFNDNVAL